MSRADPATPGTARPLRRVVALGGGHGLSRSLQALTRVAETVTAVVTVADDGGSSGRLRRDLDVVAPGDLRMALAAMGRDPGLGQLLQYRFDRGELSGHSLGNLILVALQELAGGDVVTGLDRLGALLGVPGRVLPCTTTPVVLHAEADGGRVSGQAAVSASPRVDRVWLEPSAPAATPAAVDALQAADLIVLGPGSLFTSLIPNLLVPGIGEALVAASAPRVLVANLREQRGETQGMALAEHVASLRRHLPGLTVDVLVVHAGAAPAGGPPLLADERELAGQVGAVVQADLLDGTDGHDPAALAGVLAGLADDPQRAGGR